MECSWLIVWCCIGENDMKDTRSLLDRQKAWGYCWWKESCTTDVWNPVNIGINYQPQLVIAGFLPSTVSKKSAALSSFKLKAIQQDLMLDADERATKYSIWLRWRFGVYRCISKSITWKQAHIFTPNVILCMLSGHLGDLQAIVGSLQHWSMISFKSLTCILMKLFKVKLSEMLAPTAGDCPAVPIIIWTYLNHIWTMLATSQRIHASYRFTMIYHRKKHSHADKHTIPWILFWCINQPYLCSKIPGCFPHSPKKWCPPKFQDRRQWTWSRRRVGFRHQGANHPINHLARSTRNKTQTGNNESFKMTRFVKVGNHWLGWCWVMANSKISYFFTPNLGKWFPFLTSIFVQRGCFNHELVGQLI